jgi:hypothetical protein
MGRGHAVAQEREGRFGEDHPAEPDRRQDDDCRRDVREEVAKDHAMVASPDGPGRLHVRMLGDGDRGPADDPGAGGGDDDGQGDDDVAQAGPEDRHHGEPRVDDPMDDEVEGPAEVAAGHADRGGH